MIELRQTAYFVIKIIINDAFASLTCSAFGQSYDVDVLCLYQYIYIFYVSPSMNSYNSAVYHCKL